MLTTGIPGLVWTTGTVFDESGSRRTTIRHNSDGRKFHKSRTSRNLFLRMCDTIRLCCRRSRCSRRRSRETSSARASFSIGRPNAEIREMTFNPTVARTKRKTLLLLFTATFYIVIIIIGNEMIIGRYALIMTIYYYGKHNIRTRAHAHIPRKQ